ncbi:hypothetical protein FPZ43_16915 [Mucilaginibacter pallidiroseus]|uniref:Uncharacterized protein n=1 Tax=Mucilaginibacter pallidiroseus TaxID=2599295 RepID=A0A563U0K0_9SPHI|nr:hypothetical protein [Mucilaginibacter pallidiroseus]TWR25154.1 hypothetical protein FPZ43_16915 [Mucilaginibacter pallidiroseus]
MDYNAIVLIAVGAVSSCLTFFVSERLKQGPVRASTALSLLVAGLFYVFPHILNAYLVKNIPVVFIGCSFIGMVSSRLLSSYFKLSLAAFIFCIIYLNTSKFFNGYGGALGTSASIALLAVLGLPVASVKGRFTTGYDQLIKIIYRHRRLRKVRRHRKLKSSPRK